VDGGEAEPGEDDDHGERTSEHCSMLSLVPFRIRFVGLAALVLIAFSTALVPAFGVGREGGDLTVFYPYASKVVRGAVPYRDFRLEYPPGALAAIVPPALGKPSEHTYAVRFELAMLALFAAMIVLLAGRPRAALLVALAPLLLGAVVFKRFDALPALLTLIALQLAVRRRYGWAGAALGVATAVKLYPVVLLPVLAVAAGRRHGARAVAAFVAACAVIVVPFLVLAPHGVVSSVQDQLGRHLQIETPLASLALLAHSYGALSVGVVSEAHTYGLGGRSGFALALVTSLAFLATLGLIWWRAARLVHMRHGLVLAWAATLCATVVLGRVLSPQYLIWLLPVVPLVGRKATALLAASLVLTNAWYPARYLAVVLHLDRGALWLLVARNAVLVILLLTLLRAVLPGRRARH
jgi:hypothetical protein